MAVRRTNGLAVKAIREALGIPCPALAADVGISSRYAYLIESGERQPSPAVTMRIATRLGVALDAVTYPAIPDPDSDNGSEEVA